MTRHIQLLILCLALATLSHAGIIARPVKTCGTTNYTAEVTAGCVVAKSSEVDGDLNTLYSDYNGNISNANIVSGAGISTTKLATDAGLVNAHISASAAIVGTKLAPGAAVNAVATANVTVGYSTTSTAESALVTLPAITTRGGRVLLLGTPVLYMDSCSLTDTATITLRRSTGACLAGTILRQWAFDEPLSLGEEAYLPGFITTDAPAAGTYTYCLTGKLAAGTCRLRTSNVISDAGDWIAIELS